MTVMCKEVHIGCRRNKRIANPMLLLCQCSEATGMPGTYMTRRELYVDNAACGGWFLEAG
jgi:hypothetical protein